MTHEDARMFIIALNGISQYVPPMLMMPLLQNSICKQIERIANETATTAATDVVQQGSTAKTKPHAVT